MRFGDDWAKKRRGGRGRLLLFKIDNFAMQNAIRSECKCPISIYVITSLPSSELKMNWNWNLLLEYRHAIALAVDLWFHFFFSSAHSNRTSLKCCPIKMSFDVMWCSACNTHTYSIFNAFEYILFMLSYVNGFTEFWCWCRERPITWRNSIKSTPFNLVPYRCRGTQTIHGMRDAHTAPRAPN